MYAWVMMMNRTIHAGNAIPGNVTHTIHLSVFILGIPLYGHYDRIRPSFSDSENHHNFALLLIVASITTSTPVQPLGWV